MTIDDGFRRFGRYHVKILCDGVMTLPASVLMHIGGDAAYAAFRADFPSPVVTIDVNCFVLRDDTGVTLIDAGGGPALGSGYGHARLQLADAGIDPSEVSRVLVTHLHNDHVLGLLDGDLPWLPRAEILVPSVELRFFTDQTARDALPAARHGGFIVTERLLAAYGPRVSMIGKTSPLPEVTTMNLPGHTPGHTGYLIGDDENQLLILGDCLHLGSIQANDPDIGLEFDLDPAKAAETRHGVLNESARRGWTIAGGHVGFGRVHRTSEAYAITGGDPTRT